MAGRKRYIQCPETHKLIPAEEYVRPKPKTHMVMPDIEPFQSPVDKSYITTRPQLEEHNRRHGVTNHADYSKEWLANRSKSKLRQQAREGKRQRKELIIKAMHHLDRG